MITIRQDGDVLVAQVTERRLDANAAPAFKTQLIGQIDSGARRVVVDLSQVTFIDSSGLGVLVSAMKRLGRDGSLHLCGLQPPVQSMFELTRLHRVFDIHDTPDAALGAARG